MANHSRTASFASDKLRPGANGALRSLGAITAGIAASAVNITPSRTPEPRDAGALGGNGKIRGIPAIISPSTAIDMITLVSVAAPLPGLAPAVAAMTIIVRSIQRVQYNRDKCEALSLKAQDLIFIICEYADHSEGNKLNDLFDETNLAMHYIDADVQIWASWGYFHAWFYRHEVLKKITHHEKSLDRCLETLRIATALDAHRVILENQRIGLDNQRIGMENHRVMNELVERFKSSQAEFLQPASKESQKAAEKEIWKMRTNPDREIVLSLPLELPGECRKLGNRMVTRGATYDVWEGLWLDTKKVCLKEYRDFARQGPDKVMERFQRQVNLWREMHHPYVLEFIGWTHLEGPEQLWLVTPWMERGDIMFYLKDRGLRPRKVIEWMKDMAEAIQYIHSKNVYHGCIQPSNILINDYEHAIVADLTLAKVIEADATITHTQPNVDRYRAPEALKGTPPAPASDVYSWAMVSLEIASRKMPYYEAKRPGDVIKLIYIKKVLPHLSDYTCETFETAPGVWTLIMECWNHEASKRPTLEEILSRLHGILATTL